MPPLWRRNSETKVAKKNEIWSKNDGECEKKVGEAEGYVDKAIRI